MLFKFHSSYKVFILWQSRARDFKLIEVTKGCFWALRFHLRNTLTHILLCPLAKCKNAGLLFQSDRLLYIPRQKKKKNYSKTFTGKSEESNSEEVLIMRVGREMVIGGDQQEKEYLNGDLKEK